MPATYRIVVDTVEISLSGMSQPDQVIRTFQDATEDPNCPEKFVVLLDVRQSQSLATQPTQEIIRVAEFLGPYKHRVQRCAVVATENVHFGLSRLGAVYSETAGVMTNVFRDRDEAITWLHASPE